MSELSGRVVLLPGASGALGGAVADLLLARGATVAGVARKWRPEEVGRRSDRFIAIPADLATAEGARAAVKTTLERARSLFAVVHVTGGFAGGERIEDTEDATWDRMMDVNVRAAFNVFRAAIPALRAAKHGRIVAIGSRSGVEPAATLAAYSASKAALIALVRAAAAELADSGVTANVVLPSMIDTPQNRAGDPAADVSRWVKPSAIAELIAYLLSDVAADVNGAAIPIYGGA